MSRATNQMKTTPRSLPAAPLNPISSLKTTTIPRRLGMIGHMVACLVIVMLLQKSDAATTYSWIESLPTTNAFWNQDSRWSPSEGPPGPTDNATVTIAEPAYPILPIGVTTTIANVTYATSADWGIRRQTSSNSGVTTFAVTGTLTLNIGAGTLMIGSGFTNATNALERQIAANIGHINILGGNLVFKSDGWTTDNDDGRALLGVNVSGSTTVATGSTLSLAVTTNASGGTASLGALTANGTVVLRNATNSGLRTVGVTSLAGGGTIMGNQDASGTGKTATLEITGSATSTFSGVIEDGPGTTLNLSLSGNATQTLSGDSTYSGTTVISAGTLLINGDNSLATGAVTVEENGTLGGSGVVGGATVVQGTLSPGNSTGVLAFSSSLTLEGEVTMELHGMIRGNDYDAIDVGTSLDYGGNLNLLFSSIAPVGGSFLLFDFDTDSGNFDEINLLGFYQGSLTHISGGFWSGTIDGRTFNFSTSTGTLSVIPEPSTFLLLLGLSVLLICRKGPRRNGD